MIVHIIRHTKPDIDAGICYGQTDLGLADTFELESAQLMQKLLKQYDVIYSSPLQRCTRLAEKLSSNQLNIDPRLIEYNFGDWELKPWNDFKSDRAQQWMKNFVDQAAPNGDSMLSMQARVNQFWSELLELSHKLDHKTVAIVTHAGVQRLIHGAILETPMSHLFRLQLAYGATLEVNFDKNSDLLTLKHL